MRNFIDIVTENLAQHDVSVDHQAIVHAVYSEMDWGSGDGDAAIHQYLRENPLTDDDGMDVDYDDVELGGMADIVDIKSEAFRRWFSDYVAEKYDQAEWAIGARIRDGHLTIWREITAPRDWTPDARHPGIYWSYDEQVAKAHCGSYGDSDVPWIMQATVPIDAIDWLRTLSINAQYDCEEAEVRLVDDYPVKLDGYWIRGQKPKAMKAA